MSDLTEDRHRLEETIRQSDRDWQSAMDHYQQTVRMLEERTQRAAQRNRWEERETPMTDNGTPSPDVIQFTVDMRHLVEAIRGVGLELTAHEAVQATLAVRETESRMRGMAVQGNAIVGLMHSHSQPPE